MISDPLQIWLGFLASPTAPPTAMRPVELDGYLAGVIVAPEMIPPSRWLEGLWGRDQPVFDSAAQMRMVIGAVMNHYNDIAVPIRNGLESLKAEQPHAYRPLFQPADSKPQHDVVRSWAAGFAKAMTLTPAAWSSLIEDDRMHALISPLVGFMDMGGPAFEPADNIDELLDAAAAAIPRAVIVLGELARLRARRTRHVNTGRNDSCSCGSGRKYKFCCGGK
jgi:uncharacterized protein